MEPSYLNRSLEEVSFILGCYGGKIYQSYKPYYEKHNTEFGKIVFEFTIYPSGYVDDIRVKTSEFDHPEFINELIEIISKVRFVNKDVEKKVVTYPIDFRGKRM